MAIVKMDHVRLIAMTEDREEILRRLQRLGCVEIDQAVLPADQPQSGQAPPEETDSLSLLREQLSRPDTQRLGAAREEQNQADHALSVLKKYAPAKEKFLVPKPSLDETDLFDQAAADRARQSAQEINGAFRRVNTIHAEQTKLTAQKAQLEPWRTMDLPLDTQSTAQVTVQMGTLPPEADFDAAQGAALAAGELSELTRISADRNAQYCLLVCHASQSEAVLAALKDVGWSRASLKEWSGTAAENLQRLDEELAALDQELAETEKKLSGMGELRHALRRLYDRAEADVRREESRQRLLDTSQTFYLEGWLPAERREAVQEALAPFPTAWELTEPSPEEYPAVPVKLKNNWLTRPLNMVTEMYSLPAYGSLDPNPLMAPFFILFYGMMMADMGYGLVMMLASLIVLKKKKPGGTMGHLFGLLGLCGVSTFLFGALTGGFFGDFLTQLFALTGIKTNFALPALFTPLNDTMMILVGAMCLGFVQIITGMAISFVKKLKHGQIMDAVWEEVTWWVVFAGLALAILKVTNLVIILGVVMVVAGPVLTEKGFGKVTGIFGSLYNHVTGYFGDILSYSRLMALMLAGSVIAQVFNTLGAIPGNVFIFIIISMAGNTLNFALNLLGCYVHDLRLQCLEYFNKFYEDGGKPFRPLDLNTKYYNVVKD